MKVPLLDLSKQHKPIMLDIKRTVDRVIESQSYILGEEVELFEKEIAEYCNVKYAVGVSSGTDALIISLMSANIGQGDYVITTPYSFFATAGAISRVGAKPIFVDIDKKTFNIDPNEIERLMIKKAFMKHRIKAIIPVHLFGQCANMNPIIKIAKDYNLWVIEDAAQAIGSGSAGSIGDFGCFSFFPSKNLGAFGDGGLVTTNSKESYEKLKMLRQHGSNPKYYHKIIGGNFRLDSIQAAILRVKLKYLNKWTNSRRHNSDEYEELFYEYDLSKIILPNHTSNHTYNQYTIVVPERRNELKDFLFKNNIQTEIYYPVPLNKQECYLTFHESDVLPIAEYLSKHSLSIPIYPGITLGQQIYVVKKIKEFYN